MENELHHPLEAPANPGEAGLTPPEPALHAEPAVLEDQKAAPSFVHRQRERLIRWAGLLLLFAGLLSLFWLCPVMGDDWFREELGRNLHSLSDLMDKVIAGWCTYNGRILGNILAYSAGGRKVLRELMRALFTLGTVCVAGRLAGFRSLWGTLLAAAALLALPKEMFCQIYPWAAGFFNYVPPVLFLFTALWLIRAVFAEEPLPESPLRGAAVFLLGFSGQLFIENNTLYAVWAGLVLLVWYALRRRKLSPTLVSFFLGTVLGALLLFASPSYGLIWSSGGGYETGLGGGLSGLWATVQGNQEEVLRYLIAGCPVLYLSLTALGLVWFARSARRWPDWTSAAVLLLGCVYFAANCGASLGPWATPLAVLLWGLALGAGCWRWLPKGAGRNRALFFWASSVVAAFPLLFVLPIGPRCLYLSYVFLLLTAGCLLSSLPLERLPKAAVCVSASLLAAAVLGYYLYLFLPIHSLELERDAALERAMAAGKTEVTLPAYPHGDYLWDGDSVKVGFRYYYHTPGDLTVQYVPADQWNGEG